MSEDRRPVSQAQVDRAHAYALRNKEYLENLTPKDRRPHEGGLTRGEKKKLVSPLCPETERRAQLSDSDFWDDVLSIENPPHQSGDFDEDQGEVDVQLRNEPCSECGEYGACMYDAMGRPMIHVITREED